MYEYVYDKSKMAVQQGKKTIDPLHCRHKSLECPPDAP